MRSTTIQPRSRGANIKVLNPQQQMFVKEVLASENFNYTEAARNAGYKNAATSAQSLVKNPIVMAAIGKGLQQRLDRVEFSADMVIRHLAAALTLDPIELFEPGSKGVYRIRSIDKIPEHIRRCITEIEVKEQYNDEGDVIGCYYKFKFMSKDAALALAMKHFGIAGINDKAGDQPSEALETMRLLSTLLSKVEERSNTNVIDAKFIESKVIDKGASNE